MGVYLPNWAKKISSYEKVSDKNNAEHILIIGRKVGPLQKYPKHGFIENESGAFWAWDQVIPVDGLKYDTEAFKEDVTPKVKPSPQKGEGNKGMLEAGFSQDEVLNMVIFKGCGDDVVDSIKRKASL